MSNYGKRVKEQADKRQHIKMKTIRYEYSEEQLYRLLKWDFDKGQLPAHKLAKYNELKEKFERR